MKYEIKHSLLAPGSLFLSIDGYFSSEKYDYLGNRIVVKNKQIVVKDINGAELVIKIKSQMPDLFPQFVINNQTVLIAEKLKWYELVWSALPIILVSTGGALGGALGFGAVILNTRAFHFENTKLRKYLVSGLITISIFVIYLVLAILIQKLIFNKN